MPAAFSAGDHSRERKRLMSMRPPPAAGNTMRSIWHSVHISGRTVDSHVCRLRNRLTDAAAGTVLVNRWGHGWSLTTDH
jgi:DNA-binding response OmpR family regulator